MQQFRTGFDIFSPCNLSPKGVWSRMWTDRLIIGAHSQLTVKQFPFLPLEIYWYNIYITKDLGHFWLGYIRMLGHLQMSVHLQMLFGYRHCANTKCVPHPYTFEYLGNSCSYRQLIIITPLHFGLFEDP